MAWQTALPVCVAAAIAGLCSVDYWPYWPDWTYSLRLGLMLIAGVIGARLLWRYRQARLGSGDDARNARPYPFASQQGGWIRLILTGAVIFLLAGQHAIQQTRQLLSQTITQPQTWQGRVRVEGISDGLGSRWRQQVTLVADADTVYPVGLGDGSVQRPIRILLQNPFPTEDQADEPLPWHQMQSGQQWQVQLKLRPVRGIASPGAFSVEKWLLSEHVIAVASVQQAQLQQDQPDWLDQVQRLRGYLRERILSQTGEHMPASRGILLGLLTGDRAAISPDTSRLYRYTGISHLLAISGPHVVLLAGWLTWLLLRILDRWPGVYRRWPRPRLYWLLMTGLAGGYVLLAGADIPALRTWLLLLIMTVMVWLRLRPAMALWPTLLLLLLLDPVARWSAGLWLSFGAVWLLHQLGQGGRLQADMSQPRAALPPSGITRLPYLLKSYLASTGRLQLGLLLGLLPLTLGWFGQFSWLALPVNLIAIPLLGGIIVPLALAGLLLNAISVPLADGCWQLALLILDHWHRLLENLLAQWPAAFRQWHLNPTAYLAALLLLVVFWLPGQWLGRLQKGVLGAILLAVIWFPVANRVPFRLTVLDSGRDLNVIVQFAGQNWLLHQPAQPVAATGMATGSPAGKQAETGLSQQVTLNRGTLIDGLALADSPVVVPFLSQAGISRLDRAFIQTNPAANSDVAQLEILRRQMRVHQVSHAYGTTGPQRAVPCLARWPDGWPRQPDGQHTASQARVSWWILSPWLDAPQERPDAGCTILFEISQPGRPVRRVLLLGQQSRLTEGMLRLVYPNLQADVVVTLTSGTGPRQSPEPADELFWQQLQPGYIISGGRGRAGQQPVRADSQFMAVQDRGTITLDVDPARDQPFSLNGTRQQVVWFGDPPPPPPPPPPPDQDRQPAGEDQSLEKGWFAQQTR